MDKTPTDAATGKPIPEWPMRQRIMDVLEEVKSGRKTVAVAREAVIYFARHREPNTKHEYSDNVSTQNKYGEWVPCIEEPYYLSIRKQCRCGSRFWTQEGYRAHVALVHILGL